eukprot:TRINITY_DN7605_c0_g1_i2.p1 TRINITY_DN7605_c0_g1~~TRINITY_DN7605_c0_g1_i2.p1  ORF type:complete len:266 (+),score=55.37 TRINITY_DN7605_c0_g1_i2:158-955(+)
MGTLQKFPPKCLFPPPYLINSIPSHSTPKTLFSPADFRRFCTSSVDLESTHVVFHGRSCKKNSGVRASVGVRVSGSQLKENWLDSLSCPLMEKGSHLGFDGDEADSAAASECVIGIDPDISGALAVLKGNGVGFSAQVFDTPHLQVLVGKRVRKRLDARSIVQLLRSFAVPEGTIAYIEQSRPFPKDGKQDDSRRAASALFPSLSSLLKRKKDHGRAEALLIAAYGKGFKRPSESCVECDAKEEMRSALLVKWVLNEAAETDQPI